MKRKIIHIDEVLCTGCGRCAVACHENAIAIVNGKARLLRDDYCDGLGNCLPHCPTNAITVEVREAAAYDEAAVNAGKLTSCAGSQPQALPPSLANKNAGKKEDGPQPSQLRQWPVQLRLVPTNAPYFHNAHLLVAADCTAYAYASFHHDFICGKVTLIGCPKLDTVDYKEKLTEIIRANAIRSLTVVRMEVPCCSGIAQAAAQALRQSGKNIPFQVVTVSLDGKVLAEA